VSNVKRELHNALSSLNEFMHDRPANKPTEGDKVRVNGKLRTPWPRYTPPLGTAIKRLRAAEDAVEPVAHDLQVWRARMKLVTQTTGIKTRRNCR